MLLTDLISGEDTPSQHYHLSSEFSLMRNHDQLKTNSNTQNVQYGIEPGKKGKQIREGFIKNKKKNKWEFSHLGAGEPSILTIFPTFKNYN